MPRLVGKDSSKGLIYAGLVVLLAIAGFTALEYTGTIDVIPGFGESTRPLPPERQSKQR
jgi:hypothetical protein